ncbi:heavy metal-binding protein HIP-like [Scomber japonicus]|uniref:heavy metal-binding protein HIP-like n=1 Tax=Scomber japonicus TaxID=13676 RepID=UPI002304E780|nr:heavy metal-binding protein HIP-like [Scomber japonicus]
MRRAASFLALLLCLYWTGAQGESGGLTGNDITQTEVQSEILGVKSTSDQTNISPDIWAELKELRDMAIEHSVELRNSKSKMEKLEQENTAMQTRLTASENEVEELQRENTASENEVKELKNEVMKLKIENAVLKARMKTSEDVMEKLKMENTDLQSRVTASEDKSKVLEARMNASETEVEELKRQIADQPKVAFSLGLTDSGLIGPFDTDITLKFSKVFTNFGQVYSPITGHFTAPVRGAYYFSFNAADNRSNVWSAVNLYHNDKRVLWNDDYNYGTGDNRLSNSLVLQLEKGDVVYLVLPDGCSVYDNTYDHTNFNGFLLFPL